MKWNEFTNKNFKLLTPYKYSLDNDNILLKKIKNERTNLIQFIKKNDIKYDEEIVKDYNNKMIHSFLDSRFVDKVNIMKELNRLNYMVVITWGKNNKLTIKTTHEQYMLIKPRIKMILYMIEYLRTKSKEKNKEADFYLVLTNLTKYFPENNETIDAKHVNTGFTDFYENIIFIWRLEEFEKVLFHELIHWYNMDTRDHDYHNIVDMMEANYCEAITDFWAIVYHTIYISILSRYKIKSLLEYELGFIRNQAITLNFIFDLGTWKNKPNKRIRQNTSAFSYYIIKYLLFEYALENKFELNMDIDYNKLIRSLLNRGIDSNQPQILLNKNSARMSLFQFS